MTILNHACLGSNDRPNAIKFYDAALGALGIQNLGEMGETGTLYGIDKPEFILFTPANGEDATAGNGSTLGFVGTSREAVDKFHEAGLAHGGSSEGEPGPRAISPTAYGAYLRDLDGNKICAFCFASE